MFFSWLENLQMISFYYCFAKEFSLTESVKISFVNFPVKCATSIINLLSNRLVGDESWTANKIFLAISWREMRREHCYIDLDDLSREQFVITIIFIIS